MSKPSSTLFSGTLGAKKLYQLQYKGTDKRNNATQNHRHVVSWAQKKCAELEAQSKRQREKFNTACVAFDETTGMYYYGRNGGIEKNGSPKSPILFGDSTHDGILPKQSLNNYKIGNCAEVDAINNALNAGAKLENLHITTIHTTPGNMGEYKRACENCTQSFKGRVKRNYTGWHEEDKK